MRLLCPYCSKEIDSKAKKCPSCSQPVDVVSRLSRIFEEYGYAFNRLIAVQCPNPKCKSPSSPFSSYCMKCGTIFTVAAALQQALEKPRRRWQNFRANAGPSTMRNLQLAFVAVSAVIFWLVLGYSERRSGDDWFLFALLSVVYLAFFTFLLIWLVPREYLGKFAAGTGRITKLGLVFNYFTALLLLQALLVSWKQRAIMMATLFGVSWAGFYVFLCLLYPCWLGVAAFFPEEEENSAFNVMADQGRTASKKGKQ